MFVTTWIELCLEDGIGIVVVRDHDVLVAAAWKYRETPTTISVNFTYWLLPDVHIIGLDAREERVRFIQPWLGREGGGDLDLLERMPLRFCTMWPLMGFLESGWYLDALECVRPGQVSKLPDLVEASHVNLTGKPTAACGHLNSAPPLGR